MKMPFVLGVVSRKGGVGKSTFARAIAIQALIEGKKAAIIDADRLCQTKCSRRL